jgi:hypothetical protein
MPQPIHVFMDNSNIYGGAQGAARSIEPHIPWPAVRVYIRNLARLIEGNRAALTRELAGSVPPGNDELWKYAKQLHYRTDLLRRVESDDGKLLEQGVDELLHLKIANAILDHDPKHRLVLVTGDGKLSSFGTSFPLQAERALKEGWTVEVWSWIAALSSQWKRIKDKHGSKVIIRELDPFYFSITFVKAGAYVVPGKKTTYVADRVVSRLPEGLK